MRVSLQPSYVLHQRPYRESSLVLEVFSRDHGRVGVVARGVRRARSPWRGSLQQFRLLLLSWTGRGELVSLTDVEMVELGPSLVGRGLLSGFYVNELMMRLLGRYDPCPQLFEVYRAALRGLTGAEEQEEVLRVFEKRLLEALGYALVLEVEPATGKSVLPGSRYRYRLEHGPVTEQASLEDGVPVSGETLLGLAREQLSTPELLREAKDLMRYVLRPYLGERPLASRGLFQ